MFFIFLAQLFGLAVPVLPASLVASAFLVIRLTSYLASNTQGQIQPVILVWGTSGQTSPTHTYPKLVFLLVFWTLRFGSKQK